MNKPGWDKMVWTGSIWWTKANFILAFRNEKEREFESSGVSRFMLETNSDPYPRRLAKRL